MTRWGRRLVIAAGVVAGIATEEYARASLFGEENVSLVKIVTELIHANQTLHDISDTMGNAADTTHKLLETYQKMRAGAEEIEHYSSGAFLRDLTADLYNQYPGFAKLEYASNNFQKWGQTRTSSPFTAYQAITATVADVSAPLRKDVAAGKANIDRELILKSEAAGGFAAAHSAEQATQKFDEETRDLHAVIAGSFSESQAAKVQARAQVMLVAQQSHLIRLLSRAVRLDSLDTAMAYGDRMERRNGAYRHRDEMTDMASTALRPPALMRFDDEP
jgi:hypothetical protein